MRRRRGIYRPRDLIRFAFGLTLLTYIRIVHPGTMEEIRIGRTGLKSGYADAGFFQLISKAMSEGENKCFRCSVTGLTRRYHFTDNRSGKQDLAGVQFSHLSHNQLCQWDGTDTIEFDHIQFGVKIGFREQSTDSDSGIDAGNVDWTTK